MPSPADLDDVQGARLTCVLVLCALGALMLAPSAMANGGEAGIQASGELRAAMAVSDETIIANPFQRTTYLVRLLDTARQDRLHDGTNAPASMWSQVARAAADVLHLRARPKVA